MGPYGKVLLKSAHFTPVSPSGNDPQDSSASPIHDGALQKPRLRRSARNQVQSLTGFLIRNTGKDIAEAYCRLLDALDTLCISKTDVAILIIDPQLSFTSGAWKRSIGFDAENEVEPIVLAFQSCASLLSRVYHRTAVMFTRCPFPPASYDWDQRIAEVVSDHQLYFIKPGNSVLFPSTNGFREWIEHCMDCGKRLLVMGGCTLNSCVRVSAIDTQTRFAKTGLQVVVDLSISGARASNYRPDPQFGGHSAVASAVRQMLAAGVHVVRYANWD